MVALDQDCQDRNNARIWEKAYANLGFLKKMSTKLKFRRENSPRFPLQSATFCQ